MKASVIIPCYNGIVFVETAINSVLNQSHVDLECIVIDDGSTDGSAALIKRLAETDERVIPILSETNEGVARARNRGLDAASGKWIAVLDADDRFEPDRLEYLVNLGEREQADIVVDNLSVRDYPNGAHLYAAFRCFRGGEVVELSPEIFFAESSPEIFFGRAPTTIGPLATGYMKPVFRRSFIERTGLRYDSRFKIGEDFFILAQAMAARPRFVGTSRCLYVYFRRPGSVSRSGSSPLEAMAAACTELMERYRDQYSAASRQGLRRRERIIRHLAALADFKQAYKKRRWRALLIMLCHCPSLLLKHAVFVGQAKLVYLSRGRE